MTTIYGSGGLLCLLQFTVCVAFDCGTGFSVAREEAGGDAGVGA